MPQVRKRGKGPKTGRNPRASGPLWRVDHWLGQNPGKMPENRGKARSQWSTLKSGPLARSETRKKGGKQRESQELVAHFEEWTTSTAGNGEKGRKPWKSQELVAHFKEWTTSTAGNGEKGRKLRKSREPVVHFGEWTTGWVRIRGKCPKTGEKPRASGPLWRVDH